MIPRPDLLGDTSPRGLEVFQLTAEPDVPSCHIYVDAQVFTPDSRRFVLHRSAHAHGSDPQDPRHRYLVCDIENGCELIPVTDELGTTGPAISPDGQFLYYFVNETAPGRGRLTLKRVRLDGSDHGVMMVVEDSAWRTGLFLSRPYPLSTISSDGKHIIISGFLGDGKTQNAAWGFLCVDIEKADAWIVSLGPDWCDLHPQYSRSFEPAASRDVLVQHNHGAVQDATGNVLQSVGGLGLDIHVVRDDGTALRDMPWGRDGNEFCQGHQCWIGRTERAITSTGTKEPDENQLIEGRAAPHAGHVGIRTPEGWRNELSRTFPQPRFCHFATDIAGKRLITDSSILDAGGCIYTADLPDREGEPLANWAFLLNARCSWKKGAHIHPFLSPDGSTGFFNSDESGILQAYMVRGL